ncbi:DUF6361 family protein [Kocuria sp. CPCC 205268]|uniref:DUF6361 family protein n=1 Tax=Kocuria oxytropis TaxID=3058913 RepID=UPI0034D6A135
MTSFLSWLDTDSSQRDQAMAVLDAFRDRTTVDELGVGSIRDAITQQLFPGSSVLHTRARYLLFIPWLVADAMTARDADAAVAELRRGEVRLIDVLADSDDRQGLIGGQARADLRRMPSAMYWAALRSYGITTSRSSIAGLLRDGVAFTAETRRAPNEADDAHGPALLRPGIDPHALLLRPQEWPQETSFALTPAEADYLRGRIMTSHPESLYAWFLREEVDTAEGFVWEHPRAGGFPAAMAEWVEHGRAFSVLNRGATLLYNLQLAEASEDAERTERYRADLVEWRAVVDGPDGLRGWSLNAFWRLLAGSGARIGRPTRTFVDRWHDLVVSGSGVVDDDGARELIAHRERSLKGPRARLVNPSALNAWSGSSGLVPMQYNWPIARRILDDIQAGAHVEVPA